MQIDKLIVWITSAMFLGVMILITLLNWKIDNVEKRITRIEHREGVIAEMYRRTVEKLNW